MNDSVMYERIENGRSCKNLGGDVIEISESVTATYDNEEYNHVTVVRQ